MKRGFIINIVEALLIALSAVLFSCSRVEYSQPLDNIPYPLKFDIDWNEEEGTPSSLEVMLSRVKSATRHFRYKVNADGEVLLEAPDTVALLAGGEYMITGVSSEVIDDYLFCGLDEFEQAPDVMLNDLYAEVPHLTDSQVIKLGVLDFNPVSPYLRTSGALYHIKQENQSLRSIPAQDGVKVVMERVTCRLKVRVQVEHDEDVMIDSVRGVLSGLPYKVFIHTGTIDASHTGKMLFDMLPSEEGEGYYDGELNTLGVIPPSSSLLSTGDGILNILISASTDDDEGGRIEKVFNVKVNMKNIIEAEGILDSEDGKLDNMKLTKTESLFFIKNKLTVTREHMCSEVGGGFDVWEPDDSDDEGLNPEV